MDLEDVINAAGANWGFNADTVTPGIDVTKGDRTETIDLNALIVGDDGRIAVNAEDVAWLFGLGGNGGGNNDRCRCGCFYYSGGSGSGTSLAEQIQAIIDAIDIHAMRAEHKAVNNANILNFAQSSVWGLPFGLNAHVGFGSIFAPTIGAGFMANKIITSIPPQAVNTLNRIPDMIKAFLNIPTTSTVIPALPPTLYLTQEEADRLMHNTSVVIMGPMPNIVIIPDAQANQNNAIDADTQALITSYITAAIERILSNSSTHYDFFSAMLIPVNIEGLYGVSAPMPTKGLSFAQAVNHLANLNPDAERHGVIAPSENDAVRLAKHLGGVLRTDRPTGLGFYNHIHPILKPNAHIWWT